MRYNLARLIFAIGVVFSVSVACGQTGDWYFASSAAYGDDDPGRAVDDGLVGGQLNLGREISDYLSIEALLGIGGWQGSSGPAGGYPDQTALELGANLLVYPFLDDRGRDWAIAPYVLAGIAYLGTDINPGDSDNRLSGSAGLGLRWRIGQRRLSVRLEGRVRVVFDSEAAWTGRGNLTDKMVTLGLQYEFGRAMMPPAEPVPGPEPQVFEREADVDSDRIPDSRDACPNTPAGVPVSPYGCPLDSDRDGVTTDRDSCSASRPGATVNLAGCESDDDDRDGVANDVDQCPETDAGARIDPWGCELRDIIRLPGVNFESGSDRLVAGTERLVEQAAAILNRYPELAVEVAGHTDSVGGAEVNYSLSERRAKTVRDFLIRYGVEEKRLTARGYGETEPVAGNETAAGRSENRRVELRIIRRE